MQLCYCRPSWATLPLITDDTGTQGKGKFQIEVAGEYDRDKETFGVVSVKQIDYFITPMLTYGITDTVDVFAGLPYQWSAVETETDRATLRVNGISDTVAGLKWRFYQKEGLSFGVKPFATLPTGNYHKFLGTGKTDYGILLIITEESGPWAIHANFGYSRNENRIGERKDLWHASGAVTCEIAKNVKVCADLGVDTDRDKTSEVEPAYQLGGVIYAPAEGLELSFGIKKALDDPETDWALLPGVTYHF